MVVRSKNIDSMVLSNVCHVYSICAVVHWNEKGSCSHWISNNFFHGTLLQRGGSMVYMGLEYGS